MQQRPRQRRARAFAQAQPQIEQRLRAQLRQHQRVPRLGRAVGKDAALQHVRLQTRRHQHGGAGDKAIDNNDAPL